MTRKPKVRRLTQRQLDKASAEYCRKIASQLSEHLNSVQICGTVLHADGTTSFFMHGSGDLAARMLVTDIWLEQAHHAVRNL